MVSSHHVYDVMIDHQPADRAAAEAFGRRLRGAGLRPWLWSWSAVPGAQPDDELQFAESASRVVARVLGPAGLSPWLDPHGPRIGRVAQPDVVVLPPGCRLSSRDLPDPLAHTAVLDLRRETDPTQEQDAIADAVGIPPGSNNAPMPRRRLDHVRLKNDIIRSYDCISEKFASQWVNHPPFQALETFVRLLPRRARVLDAGCGPGHHAQLLSQRGNEVMAVDLSEGMLRIARKRVRLVSFARMDMQALSFPAGTFDAIWCAAAAIHVPREEILALLCSFRRTLRPHGILGITMQVGRASEVVDYHGDRRFFEYYRDRQEIANLVSAAGLAVVASDYGETSRNTHDVDLTLKWVTVYAQASAS
jgi:SAM-dependent methyltransferase